MEAVAVLAFGMTEIIYMGVVVVNCKGVESI